MEALNLGILGTAFVAGLLVLASHVPLGHEVLKRGIIFIDLAVAQIAGFGVILAARLGFDAHGFEIQLIAIISALLGAWGLSLLEKFAQIQEALIGVVFVMAATGSILLLADNPHGGEHIKDLLIGQILWVRWEQLIPPALITAAVIFLWLRFKSKRRVLFYPLFAFAITGSVQLVGVYLVFASLIIPALTAYAYSLKKPFVAAYTVGIMGYGLGLVFSAVLDLPSGAVVVWAMAILALIGKFIFDSSSTRQKPKHPVL